MNMRYTTVIFDLDGTILNTLDDLADSVNYALRKCGYPARSRDEVCAFVGNGAKKLIERSAPQGISDEDLNKYHQVFIAHYEKHSAIKTCPYNGIPELLDKLISLGVGLGVVSNKPDIAVKPLCDRYFPGVFNTAVGEREKDGIRKKPCPDAVFEAMEKLGATPEKTLYVGDSDVDVKTAQNAGIDCAAVTWGFRSREFLKENGAVLFADNADELFDIIVKNN